MRDDKPCPAGSGSKTRAIFGGSSEPALGFFKIGGSGPLAESVDFFVVLLLALSLLIREVVGGCSVELEVDPSIEFGETYSAL
jgi:hypothetical protein